MDLLEQMESRVVCGDGAMGTLLFCRGIPVDRCVEELSISDAARVSAIHEEYVAAGARVIKTNTFGANAVRLARFGLEECVREINLAAARLALQAARRDNVCVAANIGPLGITADKAQEHGIDRAAVFREQAAALVEGGVRLLFFETFTDFAEMEIALRAAPKNDCTIICSFACDPEGRLSSGMLLADALVRVRAIGAAVVGANCLNGPDAMIQVLQRLPAGGPLAAYANAGYPKYIEGCYVYPATAAYFAAAAREMAAEGARLIGGCCGTTPAHVAAIAAALADLKPLRTKLSRITQARETAVPKI
ncbi:MAG: homocysteine S-methyltransferase family protein [Chthoniobacterales bacterium]